MKPDPEPLRRTAAAFALDASLCVLIGDSANDREAARGAGFGFVYAAYGYGPADDASLRDGLFVISKIDELPRLLCPRRSAK
jgi:phosphoglycolate phosphatase